MIRSLIGPFRNQCIRFPLATKISTLRSLHQQSNILVLSRCYKSVLQYQQCRGKKNGSKVSTLFQPVPVQLNRDAIDVGAELTGKLDKGELLKIVNKFTSKRQIQMLCKEHALDG